MTLILVSHLSYCEIRN